MQKPTPRSDGGDDFRGPIDMRQVRYNNAITGQYGAISTEGYGAQLAVQDAMFSRAIKNGVDFSATEKEDIVQYAFLILNNLS